MDGVSGHPASGCWHEDVPLLPAAPGRCHVCEAVGSHAVAEGVRPHSVPCEMPARCCRQADGSQPSWVPRHSRMLTGFCASLSEKNC